MGSNFKLNEIESLILGDKLGYGMSRVVYESKLNSTVVFKIEESARRFQNIKEWELWNEHKFYKPVADWLAPCVDISACGSILIQKRTSHPIKWPEKLPTFLTDVKKSNFGLLDGKLVCHDYGNVIFNLSLRMKKVDWPY